MFKVLRARVSNAMALAIGVLVGATLVSGVAVAAAPPLTTIADSTGTNKAGVNGAGQLLAVQSNPRNLVEVLGAGGNSTCESIYTVPAGKALIITSVTFYLQPSSVDAAEIDLRDNCSPRVIAAGISAERAVQTQTLGAGVAIPTGHTVGAASFNGVVGALMFYGYLVPSQLVPASGAPPVGKQGPALGRR